VLEQEQYDKIREEIDEKIVNLIYSEMSSGGLDEKDPAILQALIDGVESVLEFVKDERDDLIGLVKL
jgi:hypothetical protein